MKKLFTLLFALCVVVVQAQFTANRLVVTRVGDGSTALGTNTAPVSLLEFTTAGVAGTTVNLGSSTAGSRLTLGGVGAGSTTTVTAPAFSATTLEGQLSLSQDLNYLTLAGYDVPAAELSSSTGISSIAVSAGGTGYTFASVITISGGGGTGATAVINSLSSGAITGIRMTNNGSGYTSTPTVTISIGTGFTAGNITRVPYWQGIFSNRVVARLNNSATPNYSTNFISSSTPASTSGAVKQAVSVDGSKIWVNGVRLEYVAFGQTTQATSVINAGARSIGIFQNQLFYDLGFSASGLLATATSLPEASTTGASVIGMDGTNSSPGAFVFLDTRAGGDSRGYDVCYFSEIGSGLDKLYYNGSAWVPVNSTRLPVGAPLGNGLFPTTALSAITARIENGQPVIYAISYTTTNASTTTNNSIYVIRDNSAYNEAMVLGTNTVATNLVSAGANYAFRGIAFTPQTNIVLSVELTDLKAKANKTSTLLTWTTATEKNNALFQIEQSTNGTDFQTIGQVKGSGTTARAANYNFEHKDPSVGVNYYRLKQVDTNGSATYSAVRSVLFGKGGLVVKTTLVHDALDIITSDETSTPLSIFNISGQQVLNTKVQGEQRLDVSTLPIGLYIIRTATGDVGRFVKQ